MQSICSNALIFFNFVMLLLRLLRRGEGTSLSVQIHIHVRDDHSWLKTEVEVNNGVN